MKRIVIDARISGTTTGRYIDKLIEHMHNLKLGYDIILLTKPHRVDFYRKLAPEFTVVASPYKEFSFGEQLGLWWQIRKLKPGLVFFTMTQQPLLCSGPIVTTIHDLTTLRFENPSKNRLVFWFKQLVYKFVTRQVAKKSKKIITISKYVKSDIVAYTGISPDKITVIYEAADRITEPATAIKDLVGVSYIMYVGRPLPHKNLRQLIDGFVLVQQSHPELCLVLAGQKDHLYKRHERYARDKNIKNVIFTGFVSEGQLRWLYENTRAYIFPSLSEGFGLPGLEAMMHHAPVISSNATCLPEIYKDGAYYFDPHNPSDIAEKIIEVIDDKTLRSELAARGNRTAKGYSWHNTAQQTLEVFKSILKSF